MIKKCCTLVMIAGALAGCTAMSTEQGWAQQQKKLQGINHALAQENVRLKELNSNLSRENRELRQTLDKLKSLELELGKGTRNK
jgi:transposase-like protein